MGILSFLGGALKPAMDLVDKMHTSDDERGAIQIELTKLENVIKSEMLELEGKRLELEGTLIQAQSAVIIAEAQSQSWLARNWRPLVMVTFAAEIVLISTGFMDVEALQAVPPELWKLLTLGIGGYMTLRTVDKAIQKAAPGFGRKKKKE